MRTNVATPFSPGAEFYAGHIKENKPFSFVRYGEGEWKQIVGLPFLKKKRWKVEKWRDHIQFLHDTLVDIPRSDQYVLATHHRQHFIERGDWDKVEAWARRNVMGKVWHDGAVWKKAAEAGEMYCIVKAMRETVLPVVLVGPERLEKLDVPTAQHIVAHPKDALRQTKEFKAQLLKITEPSFISFTIGASANILIRWAWNHLGHCSFLINFGAVWDGLIGHPIRPYQKELSPELIKRNLYG